MPSRPAQLLFNERGVDSGEILALVDTRSRAGHLIAVFDTSKISAEIVPCDRPFHTLDSSLLFFADGDGSVVASEYHCGVACLDRVGGVLWERSDLREVSIPTRIVRQDRQKWIGVSTRKGFKLLRPSDGRELSHPQKGLEELVSNADGSLFRGVVKWGSRRHVHLGSAWNELGLKTNLEGLFVQAWCASDGALVRAGKSLHFLDAAGDEKWRLEYESEQPPKSVAFAGEVIRLATPWGGEVRTYDKTNGTLVDSIKIPKARDYCFFDEGKRVLAGDLRIYSCEDGSELADFSEALRTARQAAKG